MFDPGVMRLIEGIDIDRPTNALTLSRGLHQAFGNLEIYFEAEAGFQNRYTIKAVEPLIRRQPKLPVTRDLFITTNHNIDIPLPRLLAIHRACCLIMHASGAGEYIDKLLDDMEDSVVLRSDGTTDIGAMVSVRLHQRGEQAILNS